LTTQNSRQQRQGVKHLFAYLLPLTLLVTPALRGADNPVNSFQKALTATVEVEGPGRGSGKEQAGIRRFEDFLARLDEKTAREQTEQVYAPGAYLNDTLKTIHGAPAIRDYFIKTAKGLDSMTVTFDDVAVSGRNYYFRWTMDTRMKNLSRGKTVRTIGITLVRFDREGRVVLHQDFWDSAQGVWEHVPGVGAAIRWIRTKI
jgi:SnoaL-like domain